MPATPAPLRRRATDPVEPGAPEVDPVMLREPPRKTDWLRVAIPVLVLIGFGVFAWKSGYMNLRHGDQLGAAAERFEGVRWLGPIFIAIYAALATMAAPVSPLAYGAGIIFGLWKGTAYVWLGSMLGALAGYWLARSAWSGPARRLLGRFHARIAVLKERNAFLTALRLQILPILPFGVFNYAAGLTHMELFGFLAGTGLGILPGTVAAVYVGDQLAEGITGSSKRPLLVAALVVFAMFALSFAPAVYKRVTRRRRATDWTRDPRRRRRAKVGAGSEPIE